MRMLLLLLFLAPYWAFAGTSDCYRIKDKDAERYCLAVISGDSSKCFSIKNSDMEHMCLAEIKGKASACYSVKDPDARNICLAKARQ